MSAQNDNNKRIAKNTLMLYVRMLFSMLISLYTSRIILGALGVEDYGIYNVVGGVVALFSLLSGSLSAAVSRFLTFELGKGNEEKLASTFSTSLIVHIGLALLVFVCVETFGVWFLNNKMVIPVERLYAANWMLQFSLFSFMVGLVSVPYNASIVSHEHFKIFAYIGITDTVIKLLIATSLSWLPDTVDKLIVYSLLLFCTGILFQIFYCIYCRIHFIECRFRIFLDVKNLKDISSFAGWNFIGASSTVLRDQGGNILLNLLGGGPAVNAARGIASSVNTAVGSFVSYFMVAVNPQIMKSYATGDHKYMMSLIFRSARFSYFLLLIFGLPILLNTYYILDLWLETVPDHAVVFTQLVLVFAMCESISNPLITAMLAIGNIRNYQIVVGGLQMLNLPFSYLMLCLGFFPEIVMVVAIFISICCLFARLYMLRGMISFSVRQYIHEVVLNILFVTCSSIILPVFFTVGKDINFSMFVISCFVCMFSSGICIYYIGCNSAERSFIQRKTNSFISKIKL